MTNAYKSFANLDCALDVLGLTGLEAWRIKIFQPKQIDVIAGIDLEFPLGIRFYLTFFVFEETAHRRTFFFFIETVV